MLRQSRKSLVWVHSIKLGLLLYPWLKKHKVVLTDHGLWGLSPVRTESFPIWFRNFVAEWSFFKFLSKGIHTITTVSPYSFKVLKKFHNRVRYIPNGVDIPPYFNKISWEKKENRAVFLARHHPQKDLAFVTEIASKLVEMGWKVDFGGYGKETQKYLKYWKMRNIRYRFRSEKEKRELLKKSKLLLQPSKWEAGFTISVMEALAHKVLPVVRDYGLSKTDLADFLVVVDKKNYVEKINAALSHKYDWVYLGRLLKTKYSWKNIARQYEEVLGEAE